MEDAWLCIEDDVSSHHSSSYSDVIDSETEAELYSTIHYEENLNFHNSESVNFQSSEQFVQNGSSVLTPNKDIFCAKEKSKNKQTPLVDTQAELISHDHVNSSEEHKKLSDRNVFLNKFKQDLNPAKKRKSYYERKLSKVDLCISDPEDIDLNQPKFKSVNNIKNETIGHNVHVKQGSQKKNTVVDSSDSDSIIWREVNSPEKCDLKTNVMNDVDAVYLSSSDSDVESSVLLPLMKRDSILKNLSMPNIKMGEKHGGLWHINDEDLYRQKKYSWRYHENMDIKCSNCNKKGHTQRTCSVPKIIKCFICGGTHLGSRCVNRICSNCYGFGHDRKRCWMGPNLFYCTLCNREGHIKENCPDLWRRYHLTTESIKIVQGKQVKQDTDLYCWNCGARGHFGGVCQAKVYRNCVTTWPCVISYDDPGELLSTRLTNLKQNQLIGRCGRIRRNEYLNHRRNLSVTLNTNGKKVRLKQRNELNTTEGFMEERKSRNKNKKRRKKSDLQFKKTHKIVRERDFPRSPKQEIPQQIEGMPESVELLIKKQLRKKKRNLKRRLKRQKKELQAGAQGLQTVM